MRLVPRMSARVVESCAVVFGERNKHSFALIAHGDAVIRTESGDGPLGRMRALARVREYAKSHGWSIVDTDLTEPFDELAELDPLNAMERLTFQGIVPPDERRSLKKGV